MPIRVSVDHHTCQQLQEAVSGKVAEAGMRVWRTNQTEKRPAKTHASQHFLTNARSLNNKMDELELITESRNSVCDCSIMVITETWLHTDEAILLAGRTVHRADRNDEPSKNRGGGLCIYSNNKWCTNAKAIERHCSPDVEFITLRCQPFYLPREFTVAFIMTVYSTQCSVLSQH